MKSVIRSALCAALVAGLGLAAQPARADDGEQVYQLICQGCHMPDGKGAEAAGHYPAFAGNPNMASAQYMALIILNGRRNMPSFIESDAARGGFWEKVMLTDEQVAGVVNYIRNHFGNAYKDKLTAADVESMHPQ